MNRMDLLLGPIHPSNIGLRGHTMRTLPSSFVNCVSFAGGPQNSIAKCTVRLPVVSGAACVQLKLID